MFIKKFTDKKGTFFYSKDDKGNENMIHSYAIWNDGTLLARVNNLYRPVFRHANRLYTYSIKPFKPRQHSISVPLPIQGPFGLMTLPVTWTDNDGNGINYAMIDMETGNVY